jgi:hypothetical protein
MPDHHSIRENKGLKSWGWEEALPEEGRAAIDSVLRFLTRVARLAGIAKAVYGLFAPEAVIGPCFSTGAGITRGDETEGQTRGPFMGVLAVERAAGTDDAAGFAHREKPRKRGSTDPFARHSAVVSATQPGMNAGPNTAFGGQGPSVALLFGLDPIYFGAAGASRSRSSHSVWVTRASSST